jgi:hypothetical protein
MPVVANSTEMCKNDKQKVAIIIKKIIWCKITVLCIENIYKSGPADFQSRNGLANSIELEVDGAASTRHH